MTSARKAAGASEEERPLPGAPNNEQRESGVADAEAEGPAIGAFGSHSEQKDPIDAENASAGDAEAAVDADLDALIADVTRERDEYLELAQRARADFENYRKRAVGDVSDAERRGKAGIARELVPVIDNLERALDAASEDDPLREGVALVHRDLVGVLARAGVESYDPAGEAFDPEIHEALATRPTDGAASGTVIETLERGYRLDGQLIRAARVVVAE